MARTSRKKPLPLSESLTTLLRRMGIDQKVKKSKVLVDWPEFVGPRIAQVSEPDRLVGDTLYVRVKSDSWRSELALMKRSIINKMLQRYGEELITDIRFI